MTPDGSPVGHEVGADATLRRGFTADNPARVRVTFWNLADTERVFWFGTVVPFTPKRVVHESRDAELQLVPPDGAGAVDTNEDGEFHPIPERPTDGCWRAEDAVVFSDEARFERVAPCERLAATFDVVGAPSNDGCPPSGTYRAERTWHTSNDYGETSRAVEIRWGFDLTLG